MQIRRLNAQGIEWFRDYLGELRNGSKSPPPEHLLTEDVASEAVAPYAELDTSALDGSKLRLALTVESALQPLERVAGLDRDVGLWSWLALALFDEICPARSDGARRPSSSYQYILSDDYRHYHRHLVRSPWLVRHLHGEHGLVTLVGPASQHGEAAEQLLSRTPVVTNKPLFAALSRLYVEKHGGQVRHRRGAAGRNGGSFRRVGKIIRQFDLTYDLHAMQPDEILNLLPREFDKFKKKLGEQPASLALVDQ